MKRLLKNALGLAAVAVALRFASRRRLFPLKGKVVLITGGARGLGLALARRFAAQGAKLMLTARDAAELERAAKEFEAAGVPVATTAADATDAGAAERVIRETLEKFGRLDVLVNNAGIIIVGPLENMEPADYEKAMAIHFWAPLRFMTAARPHLRETRGRIVNICSVGGKIAAPHMAPYTASKFALAGLSDAFRNELAAEKIAVTSVFPGMMRTGSQVQAVFKGRQQAEFAWFALGGATPLTSISVQRAAAQIVRACREGRPELVITFQARLAILGAAIFPNLAAGILKLVNRLLPSAGPAGPGIRGREARGAFPPRLLTGLSDRAGEAHNE